MALTEGNVDLLTQPIDPRRVSQRSGGGGKTLSYIQSHDAIRTANDIFGLGGYSVAVEKLTHVGTEVVEKNDRKGYRVGYIATTKVTLGPPNAPYGHYTDTGYGDAVEYGGSTITPHELASKEAVSDAVKRCLRYLGDQFGLSLYSEEGRSEVAAARQALDAVPALKRQVYEIAVGKLELDKPTQAQLAKAFGVKVAELQDISVLRGIVAEHG